METLTQIACVSGAVMDTQCSRWNENNQINLKKKKVGIKKKLKLLNGLSKDLSTFSDMGFASVDDNNDLLLQVRGKMITEAAEVLLKQLEQLKAEEKELKRKRKQEKAKIKGQMWSSCSCESSEEEEEEEEVLTSENNKVKVNGIKEETSGCCTDAITKRVEVCMGNKCKKLGGEALLEEFQRVVGVEGGGVVVGSCKCMGKCRDGPNVRLFSSLPHATTPINPLCIGVGLEDVSAIFTNYFAHDTEQLDLNAAFSFSAPPLSNT